MAAPWTSAPAESGGLATREARIKGWHDSQVLAERGPDGVLRPLSPATIVPVANSGSQPESYFGSAGSGPAPWRHAATIILPADFGTTPQTENSKYRVKWGLRAGQNLVHVRKSGQSWEVQIRNAAGAVVGNWVNVERHLHYEAAVPGTARWRWTRYDDGVWFPCGQACCRADGDS
jgi:hypothetical protein